MSAFIQSLSVIVAILYFLLVYEYGHLFLTEDTRGESRAARILRVAVAIHLLLIGLRGISLGHLPFTTMSDTLGAVSIGLSLVYLFIELRLGIRTTGVFILGLAFLFQAGSAGIMRAPGELDPLFRSPLFGAHVVNALIGCAAIAVSAIYGMLYLLLRKNLKRQDFGRLYRKLPPLETLALMNYYAAAFGFLFLTISIGVGAYWAADAIKTPWLQDPKTAVALAMWALLGFVVGVKLIGQWRPRWNAWCAIIGFIMMVLSMVVINLLFSGYHTFN